MKFSLRLSIKIERSDALERALQEINSVGTDNPSETDQEPSEVDDDQVVAFGFMS
jgi:hypothetical protein